MAQPTAQSVGGEMTYDGTPESRIRIQNWQRETFVDPGEPFFVKLGPDDIPVELHAGAVLVRFPNNTYGIEESAGEPE